MRPRGVLCIIPPCARQSTLGVEIVPTNTTCSPLESIPYQLVRRDIRAFPCINSNRVPHSPNPFLDCYPALGAQTDGISRRFLAGQESSMSSFASLHSISGTRIQDPVPINRIELLRAICAPGIRAGLAEVLPQERQTLFVRFIPTRSLLLTAFESANTTNSAPLAAKRRRIRDSPELP